MPSRPSSTDQQKTLTQIDFVSKIPSSMSEDGSDLELGDLNASKLVPRKRRKTATRPTMSKRQSTLTQIPFFDADEESDDNSEVVAPQQAPQSNVISEDWHDSIYVDDTASGPHDSTHSQEHNKQRSMSGAFTFRATTPAPSFSSPSSSRYHTPKERMKHQVPSSQSPSLTPLSQRQSEVLPQERRALQNIPTNKLAMRDLQSKEKSNLPKLPKKRKIVPDSAASSEYEDNAENMEPESDSEMEDSQPESPIKSRKISSNSSPLQSHWSHSPLIPSAFGSMAPPATIRSEPRNLSGTIRTSQATTVDITQPSPRTHSNFKALDIKSPLSNRVSYPPVSPESPEEPYTLATIDSQYPMDDIEVSPTSQSGKDLNDEDFVGMPVGRLDFGI
ncbi:MAG: hypothetical protein M1828_000738 [Chrysothrix sp. TS-e1954]|nr:MAG: hypothetical protein M1828_000738 [Chrysothrix sp. TS-e1954]